MARNYQFVGRFASRILNKLHATEIRCYRCGKPIHVGDRIHLNETQKKIYHFDCFMSMFYDPSKRRRSECLNQAVPS